MKAIHCGLVKEHSFWERFAEVETRLVPNPAIATSLHENLGELLFHLGSFPGGMEDKAFIALLKDFDMINSDTIFNLEICDCDPNFEETKVLSCGNARIERNSSSNVI